MNAHPLSDEDRAILALESPTVAGHTCKLLVLDGEIDEMALRDSIADRLDRIPRLRYRLATADGAPAWIEDDEIDLRLHLTTVAQSDPVDAAGLRELVARLFEQRLDRSGPLWRIDVVPRLSGGGSALVWRLHHALADGQTAMRIADAVIWDPLQAAADTLTHKRGPAPSAERDRGPGWVRRELLRTRHRSPFDGPVGERRALAFASVSLSSLKRAASAHGGATVNDAVLTLVAGGLRRWLQARHGALQDLRAKVPVSLHRAASADSERGNRDSFFCVELPVAEADPIARLAAVRAATAKRKSAHDAERIDHLLRELGAASSSLRAFAEHVLAHPRSFSLNVSNVTGPRAPIGVLGVPVRSLHSIAEIRERHALRIAVVSLGDKLGFGLCADPTIVDGVEEIASGIELDAAALTGEAPADARQPIGA
jgi:wax ester synthase-like acyl-CoA acyltransferase family protein/uncharacterized protein DUF1298